MITLKEVQNDPQIFQFIKKTEEALGGLAYTDHGLRHSKIVSKRATQIAKAIGLSERNQELSAMAAYCHDMGNFVGRPFHNYTAAILFHQVFQNKIEPEELTVIMQAIS